MMPMEVRLASASSVRSGSAVFQMARNSSYLFPGDSLSPRASAQRGRPNMTLGLCSALSEEDQAVEVLGHPTRVTPGERSS
jgi:hypothetical protein